jgi:hypothetical protein
VPGYPDYGIAGKGGYKWHDIPRILQPDLI